MSSTSAVQMRHPGCWPAPSAAADAAHRWLCDLPCMLLCRRCCCCCARGSHKISSNTAERSGSSTAASWRLTCVRHMRMLPPLPLLVIVVRVLQLQARQQWLTLFLSFSTVSRQTLRSVLAPGQPPAVSSHAGSMCQPVLRLAPTAHACTQTAS
jgi:hypothetical protein